MCVYRHVNRKDCSLIFGSPVFPHQMFPTSLIYPTIPSLRHCYNTTVSLIYPQFPPYGTVTILQYLLFTPIIPSLRRCCTGTVFVASIENRCSYSCCSCFILETYVRFCTKLDTEENLYKKERKYNYCNCGIKTSRCRVQKLMKKK